MNLQGLEDILKRITPGPWYFGRSYVTTDICNQPGYPPKPGVIASLDDGEYIENENCENDAQFIATARNVMPEMLAFVRAWDARQEHFKAIENGELCKDQYAWDLGDKLWADIEKARDAFIDKLESEEA